MAWRAACHFSCSIKASIGSFLRLMDLAFWACAVGRPSHRRDLFVFGAALSRASRGSRVAHSCGAPLTCEPLNARVSAQPHSTSPRAYWVDSISAYSQYTRPLSAGLVLASPAEAAVTR